ncbi:MAG: response regulator [Acidimicrobiia bacterium]|nr:response regulator [Acidimicrobiia bacterium]
MSRNKVVLVVDDVPSIVQLIRGALADQAVDLVAAADGQTGLDLARSLVPDLILLDLALPVMDGWDVLAALKADDTTAPVPVVIVTAHGDSDSASRARELGASAFIAKPFRPAELRRIIAKMFEPLAAAG